MNLSIHDNNMDLSIHDIVAATKAEVLSLHHQTVSNVGTDTRKKLTNHLFVALRGNHFDAHDFTEQAVEQGATALLLDQREIAEKWAQGKISRSNSKTSSERNSGASSSYQSANTNATITCLLVKDTLKALQDLAHHWRTQLSAIVVGLTGSNGKTTTKEFLVTLLEKDFHVTANQESFNNHWGVPLTLLSCRKSDEVVILEMGMNHPEEITQLCHIAEPNIAMVTNVGSAHISELGSVEKIAKAKSEIYRYGSHAKTKTGTDIHTHNQGIFNLDNEHTLKMWESFKGKNKWSFSQWKKESTVCIHVTHMGWDFIKLEGHIKDVKGSTRVPVFGRHNVENIMAAATTAVALGLAPEKIWNSLKFCKNTWGRNQFFKLNSGAQVLFDAYNSSPESFKVLVQNLSEVHKNGCRKKQLIFIVGQMLEIGVESAQQHREIGQQVASLQPSRLWFIGPNPQDRKAFQQGFESSSHKNHGTSEPVIYLSESYEQNFSQTMGSALSHDHMVIIKGSRGIHLEKVLQSWNLPSKPA